MRNETVQIDLARYEQFQRRGVAEFQMLFYSFISNINLFTRNVGEVDLTGLTAKIYADFFAEDMLSFNSYAITVL